MPSTAEYMREYRRRRPEYREQNRLRNAAYNTARAELIERHRAEFETLYRAALEELHIDGQVDG